MLSQDERVAHPGDLVTLGEQRERAREVLADRYANGVLDLDAYEVRIDTVERAQDIATIESTIADLRPPGVVEADPGTAVARRLGSMEVVPRDQAREKDRLVSILGQVNRKGSWDVPRRLKVTAVLADVELDLREARLADGVTEIHVTSIMAQVTIIAPPGLRVVMEGGSVLGEFDGTDTGAREGSGPTVRVTGTAFLGEVELKERVVGESGWQAFWRRRRERKKKRRKALRGRRQRQLRRGSHDSDD
jgi:hypothetical protein